MNENGENNNRRATDALRQFVRSRWEDRDATLFLTTKKNSQTSRPIQSGPVVPPQYRQNQPTNQGFAASAIPVAPRQWTPTAPATAPTQYAAAAKPAAAPAGSKPPVGRHESGIINPEATSKGRELLKHWNESKNCQLCPLGKTRNCFVYGMGKADTPLVFIGEAPGQQEDTQGLPFVGASGKMLDGILASLNLSRDSYFICNVLKCRPPENRNPLPDEIEKCAPYLEKQMKILAPKYVVALGTFAAQSVLKTIKPIGQLRGKWHQLPDFEVLPVYHPSAACRSGANKKVLEDDLKFLKKRLDADKA